jgi:hypothetical protein
MIKTDDLILMGAMAILAFVLWPKRASTAQATDGTLYVQPSTFPVYGDQFAGWLSSGAGGRPGDPDGSANYAGWAANSTTNPRAWK